MFIMFDSEHKPLQRKVEIKRWTRWLFVGILAAVIILIDILTGWIQFPPAVSYGNTSGNIANSGLVAESDGWIYYSDYPGRDYPGGLNKMRPDGSDKTKLYDDYCSFININGGWIYFNNHNSHTLYKISTDGTGLTKLTDSYSYVCLENGWLYYISTKDGSIWKIRTDGTDNTQVGSNMAFGISVADGWIYYCNYDDNSSLYKIKADGTGETKLGSRTVYFCINVEGDYVYYTAKDNEKWCIYRIRTDGTGEIKLSGDLFCYNFNVFNGWIYYSFDNFSLHKMRIDGAEDVKLGDDFKSSMFINIAGDWIYYYNNGLYRMKTDGTENQRVE